MDPTIEAYEEMDKILKSKVLADAVTNMGMSMHDYFPLLWTKENELMPGATDDDPVDPNPNDIDDPGHQTMLFSRYHQARQLDVINQNRSKAYRRARANEKKAALKEYGERMPAQERAIFSRMCNGHTRPFTEATYRDMKYPEYRGKGRSEGNPGSMHRLVRMKDVNEFKAYASRIQSKQSENHWFELVPCHWCGLPGGNYCEGCEEKSPSSKGAHILCTYCERFYINCRLCRLEGQISTADLKTTHRARDGSWLGTNKCHNCDRQQQSLKVCQGCGIARYCNETCQKNHWEQHKPYCQFFVQQQPLFFIHPWFLDRAKKATKHCKELLPPIQTKNAAKE